MKAAFAVWENRIAPVFDVAGRVCIVESGKEPVLQRETLELPEGHASTKAGFLADRRVEILVCGAVTGPARWFLVSRGIRVIAFVTGELDEVIAAWLDGRLPRDESFLMPGCRGFRRRGGMGGKRSGGPGAGRCSGGCFCRACGHREAQVPGTPCRQRECPLCGAPMTKMMERRH